MTSNSRFSNDPRPLVAVDWSVHHVHVTFDGDEVSRLADVVELLSQLDGPHKLVAESTFESWDADRRATLVDKVRGDGHELYVYRPRHTERARKTLGLKKSDANDARIIFYNATVGGIHVYPIPTQDPTWVATRETLNAEYLQLRASGGKDDLLAAAVAVLGPYSKLDDEARVVLGNGKKYSASLLAAAFFAAYHSPSRRVFERLLGLHGSAYPSLLRSDVLHHSFRHARKRGVEWTTFRRVLRRTYRQLRADIDGRGVADLSELLAP